MNQRIKNFARTMYYERQRRGLLLAMDWVIRRGWLRSPWIRSRQVKSQPSDLPLEVLIPCGTRDLVVLPICVESIWRFVFHPIQRIIVVTNAVKDAAAVLRGISKVDIIDENEWINSLGLEKSIRGGVLQQVLKIEGRHFISTEHYLVVDADTVFLVPRIFAVDGRYILRYTESYEKAYYKILDKFLPGIMRFPVSFVAHHMLFSRSILNNFINHWEANCGESWIEHAVKADNEVLCALSEYELYANGLIADYPDRIQLEYWNGINVKGMPIPKNLEETISIFPRRTSASFHWFLRPEYLNKQTSSP